MLKQHRQDVGGEHQQVSFAIPHSRDTAVLANHVIERGSGCIAMGPLHIGPQALIGDCPQGKHRLVGVEREVYAWRTLRAARVPREPAGAVRRHSFVQPEEVPAVDLAAAVDTRDCDGPVPLPLICLPMNLWSLGTRSANEIAI